MKGHLKEPILRICADCGEDFFQGGNAPQKYCGNRKEKTGCAYKRKNYHKKVEPKPPREKAVSGTAREFREVYGREGTEKEIKIYTAWRKANKGFWSEVKKRSRIAIKR